MSPEEAVRERLLTLNTTAGSRVWMLKLPQDPTVPAARVQMISDPTEYHLRGGITLGEARVQVDAYAREASGGDPYDEANDLATQIHGDDAGSGLSGAQWDSATSPTFEVTGCFRLDRRCFYDPDERRMVVIQQDYQVHYRRT